LDNLAKNAGLDEETLELELAARGRIRGTGWKK
jgi:hypothetical protein